MRSFVGKAIVGVSSGEADFQTINKTGGTKTVTLTTAQMPKHSHTVKMWQNSNEAASYGLQYNGTGFGGRCVVTTDTGNTTTSETGSTESHNNLQPYQCAYTFTRTA